MAINSKEMAHLANLARLNLSEEESAKIAADLNNILDYVEELKEVNTEGVEALVSVLDTETPLRKDRSVPSLSQEEALKNAPEKNSDYFKVPKVLG